MIGERFGKLVVVADTGRRSAAWKRIYTCVCDCGATKDIIGNSLKTGNTRSCGCERAALASARRYKHGRGTSDRTYRTWSAMRWRCNPRSEKYRTYGARGISVCERWNDFRNFLADMGEAPDGMSLGRIDNDGNYCPENCRWETPAQQSRNTSANVFIEYNGRRQCIADWAVELGLGNSVINQRMARGWTPTECIEGRS